MNPQRITLKDIAQKAGVSNATVSYALRNHPRISESTRKRILTVAKDMGYQPDPKMAELMSYMRNLRHVEINSAIAVLDVRISPGIYLKGDYFGELMSGIKARAEMLGFHIDRINMSEFKTSPDRLKKVLQTRGINGIIIPWLNHDFILPDLNWDNTTVVSIANVPQNTPTHLVKPNYFQSMRLMMTHLRELGYTRIGLAVDNPEDKDDRYRWYGAFLYENQYTPEANRIPIYSGDALAESKQDKKRATKSSHEGLIKWYKQYQPEVVIGLAKRAYLSLIESGLSIPKDVAYADLHWRETYGLEIAGINQDSKRIGIQAVEMLTGLINNHQFGIPESPSTNVVNGKWQSGNSILSKTK